MKILHVMPYYYPALRYGGTVYSVHGLCKSLVRLGHDVHVATTNMDGPYDLDVPSGRCSEIDGVRVWYFPAKGFRRIFWSPPMARMLFARTKEFDVVHLHTIFTWPTLYAAKQAFKTGVPYVDEPHGMLIKDMFLRKSRWLKFAWLKLFGRRFIERAAAIRTSSAYETDELAKFGLKLPPVYQVSHGVDIELSRDAEQGISAHIRPLLEKTPSMLFLSRINWKKGLDRLISAMAHLPDIPLIIAGNDEDDYQPVLEELAEKNGVRKRIFFAGPVYGSDKAALFANATLFVLPSYSENFGTVILEAMAAGCPVIVTPEVGAADIVRESGAGLVVNGEPDVLGNCLKDLLGNPEQLRLMGQRGRQAAVDHFTWDVVGRQMVESYQSILKK